MGEVGDENEIEAAAATAAEPVGGCAVHGAALLIASAAVMILMALVTVGCWLLYRLIA